MVAPTTMKHHPSVETDVLAGPYNSDMDIVINTGRAGGLHKPPWGISHAEPIGSSNNPPLAVIAPPPQMWQSLKNCLPQWGKVAAVG